MILFPIENPKKIWIVCWIFRQSCNVYLIAHRICVFFDCVIASRIFSTINFSEVFCHELNLPRFRLELFNCSQLKSPYHVWRHVPAAY